MGFNGRNFVVDLDWRSVDGGRGDIFRNECMSSDTIGSFPLSCLASANDRQRFSRREPARERIGLAFDFLGESLVEGWRRAISNDLVTRSPDSSEDDDLTLWTESAILLTVVDVWRNFLARDLQETVSSFGENLTGGKSPKGLVFFPDATYALRSKSWSPPREIQS